MATMRARIPGGVGSELMWAVVTTGNGSYEKLEYAQVPRPVPLQGEVLLRVLAAGVNNTEINTRLGWYSKTVTTGTNEDQSHQDAVTEGDKEDGGWGKPTPFPFIQGTDCCGEVVALGPGVSEDLLGRRALVRSCHYTKDCDWFGSDFDGSFAQFTAVPAAEVFPVNCSWSHEELASLPCAYATSESMLHKAGVADGERVLIPGVSGGVASATVQLSKRRGAHVTGITSASKVEMLEGIGLDEIVIRGEENWSAMYKSFDVVVDNVGGPGFPQLIECLKPGGRYVTSGAIGGPIVSLDLRTLYLSNITMIGSTAWPEHVFRSLVSYVEKNEIKPLVDMVYPLERIVEAQQVFLEKKHVGKFVLIPPQDESA